MNVYEKLQACRVDLQQAKLKKSGLNKFSGFSYFELADFLPTVNELFKKYKLCSNFSLSKENATLRIYDSEVADNDNYSKKEIEFTSPVEELELKGCNKIQALGGVHTYLKRYLYMNALEIVESDMFDAVAGKDETKTTSKPIKSDKEVEYINSQQKQELKNKLSPKAFAEVMNTCGGKLTVEQYNQIINGKCMQIK